mmetsp:Transcript_17551/g.43779  ORF Transcript_17551/g.43779 Transcript_17551/m.43779 type:complete len:984 (+) Transcript_17551:110-3061(+)
MDDRAGGRGYYRGGGGRHRHHRGRGRGRGRGHRHQPYNNNRGRYNNNHGGRGRRPGNRFGAGSVAQQDPHAAMLRQVSSFVSRAGELKNIQTTAGEQQGLQLRPVVATTAGNINDLVTVLCSQDKLDMLFKYQPASTPGIKTSEKVGNLGHMVISCAASLPLQTPCYAALTVAINEQIKGCQWEGFAHRCMEYATFNFLSDLDTVLGTGKDVAHAACRMKLLLRYLAILGKIGVVKGYDNPPEGTPDYNKLSIFGLLSVLVQTAKVSQARKLPVTVTNLLISLVLSTLPYVVEYVPQDAIADLILKPIEAMLQNYKSTFTPGTGCTSILLKGEQDDGEEMDDDDEEEDDEDDSSGQVCDSLQDLLRVCKNLTSGSRFALPSDAPWKGLIRRVTPNPESGETEETQPVAFSDETMHLSVTASNALRFLLGGEGEFNFVPFSLDGVVFGRLPIFGSGPDPDDDEEDAEEEGIKNEELEAFHKNFGLLDRFFVADVIRDCLITHETYVNDTGLQLGSPKSVAEELLSVCHLFVGENPSQGIAFAVVETLFGLIVQSRNQCALRHTSLSRVLLELTRLRPLLISPALAIAMTNSFEDYLPSLVPIARENISRWFAFHLTNTDYQWPAAYWRLWEPYATSKKLSSRGSFVKRTIQVMVENVTDPNVVINGCLANTKALAEECFPQSKTPFVEYAEADPFTQFETEIEKQVWELEENPDTLGDNILQYESNGALAATKGRWVKTIALTRVLVSPLKNIRKSLNDAMSKKEEEDGMDQMIDDTHESKDYYIIVTDAIQKYGRSLKKIMAKEAELYGDVSEGGALALRNIEEVANFNASLLQGLVSCFVNHSVLDGNAIARWALGDLGEAGTSDVVPRWWEFASDALVSTKPAGGTEGMIVDGSAAEASAAAARQLILAYATRRVCSLLATNNQKRLDPVQVDLLEGMKCVAFESKSLDGSNANVLPLVDLCSGSGGSMAVELLKSSLMQL